MSRGIRHFLNMTVMLMGALIAGAGMALLRALQPSRVAREQTQVYLPRAQDPKTQVEGCVKHATADMDMDLDRDMDLDMNMKDEGQELDRIQELDRSQGLNKREIVFGHLTFLR